MTTLARRSLLWGAVLWLGAACGGDETPSASAPNTGTTPPTAGTSAPSTPPVQTPSPSTTVGTPSGSISQAGTAGPTMPTKMGTAGSAAAQPGPSAGTGGGAGPMASAGAGGVAPPPTPVGKPNLFWLEFNSSRVMQSKDMKTATMLASTGVAPDGVAVDVAGGKVYWTNMGSALGTGGGTVQRSNLDGSNVETIVPAGVGTTFKQTTLDLTNQKIYWGDREGAKLWRANLDGSMHEAIVSGHGIREVVGVVVDVAGGKVYYTDRTGGKIQRVNIEMPQGATGENRMDVEDVLVVTGGSTPIDLEIDHVAKTLYWTDRMLGTVHRMNLEMPAGMSATNRSDDKVIVPGLSEPIGICLDVPNNKMYFTELGGTISVAALDGSGLERGIFRSNGATGCALAYLPN